VLNFWYFNSYNVVFEANYVQFLHNQVGNNLAQKWIILKKLLTWVNRFKTKARRLYISSVPIHEGKKIIIFWLIKLANKMSVLLEDFLGKVLLRLSMGTWKNFRECLKFPAKILYINHSLSLHRFSFILYTVLCSFKGTVARAGQSRKLFDISIGFGVKCCDQLCHWTKWWHFPRYLLGQRIYSIIERKYIWKAYINTPSHTLNSKYVLICMFWKTFMYVCTACWLPVVVGGRPNYLGCWLTLCCSANCKKKVGTQNGCIFFICLVNLNLFLFPI
jgi:hypothetical protein